MADSDSSTTNNVKAPKQLSTKPLPTIVKDSISDLNDTLDNNTSNLTNQLSNLNENFKNDISIRGDISSSLKDEIISRNNISKNLEDLNGHLRDEIISKDKLSNGLSELNDTLLAKNSEVAEGVLNSTQGVTDKLRNLGVAFKDNLYESVDKLLGFFSDSYKKTGKKNKKASRRSSRRMKKIAKKINNIDWNTDYTNDLLLKMFNTLSSFFSVYEDRIEKEKKENIFTSIRKNEPEDIEKQKQFGEQIEKKKKKSSFMSILKGLGFVAAVGLLTYGLYKAYEGFQKLNDWWKNTTPEQKWEDVKKKLKEWWDQGWLGPVLGVLGGLLAVKVAGAMGIPKGELVAKVAKGVVKNAGKLWAFYSAYKGVDAYMETLKDGGSQAEAVVAGAKGFFNQLLSPFALAIDAVLGEGTTKKFIDDFVDGVYKVGEKIGEWTAYLVSGQAWKDVKNACVNFAKNIGKWVKTTWNNIKKWWNGFSIKDTVFNLVEAIGSWFKEKWNDIKSSWDSDKSIWENITNIASKIGNWISNWFKNLWETVKNKLMFWKKDNKPEKPIENTKESDEALFKRLQEKISKSGTLKSLTDEEKKQWQRLLHVDLKHREIEPVKKVEKKENEVEIEKPIVEKKEDSILTKIEGITKKPINLEKQISNAKGIIKETVQKTKNQFISLQNNVNNQPVTTQNNVNNSNIVSPMSSNDSYGFGFNRLGDIYKGFMGN